MLILINLFIFSRLFLAISGVFTDKVSKDNLIAVYWGQESHKVKQRELSYYCESNSVDIIILAFISTFGDGYGRKDTEKDKFEINLSNYCNINENGHYKCEKVGEDIRKCQESGKKVLLSLGGEQLKESTYGFKSTDEAKVFAKTLWNYFGEGKDNSIRPFGDSVIDGFDIDSENENQVGYLELIKELSNLSSVEGSKKFYFSSAPQCNFPDKSNSELIDGFELDYLFVQFYNNECVIDSKSFNFNDWSDHLISLNFNTKIFLGLPSSRTSTENGFIDDIDILTDKVNEVKEFKNFGGLMFWDASKGFDSNFRDSVDDSYIYKIWKNLDGLSDPVGATITTSESQGEKLNSKKNRGSKLKPSIMMIITTIFFTFC